MVGVDEVGRGCLAGPLLVVAARTKTSLPANLRDSKLLTKAKREALYVELIKSCEFGEGWVQVSEIDRRGLAAALCLGAARAVRQLGASASEQIIIDGPINYLPKKYVNVTALIDADESIQLVSAASIYAKVVRDRYMSDLASRYPNYNFHSNAGYGTAEHFEALSKLGPKKNIHRFSFAPLKQTGLL